MELELQEEEMSQRLLLADDSITIQKVVELTLSEEGFDVTAVGDGEAALEAVKRVAPVVILADVFMPKMDGYELCTRIKQDPALKHIPVILLAGTFENFDEVSAMRAGADDHLTKPFESAELISKVKKYAQQGAQAFEAEEVEEAEVVEEAFLAEEVEGPAAGSPDDLWSVVDMSSQDQPLSGATEILTEDELWRRAKLTPELDSQGSGGLSWDAEPAAEFDNELSSGPFEAADVMEEPAADAGVFDADVFEAAEVEEVMDIEAAGLAAGPFEASDPDQTRILNLSDYAAPFEEEEAEPVELSPVELSEVDEPTNFMTFDTLGDALEVTEEAQPVYSPPASPRLEEPREVSPSGQLSVSPEALREEVIKAVRQVLDERLHEVLSGISRDVIERVVWDVVPDLAEEIISREIDKLKSGI
jgi:CheY-like chemotaxis protein